MGNRFSGEGFTGSLGAHQQDTARMGQPVGMGFGAEGQPAPVEPGFELVESANFAGVRSGGAVLQQVAAPQSEPLFLEHIIEIGGIQTAVARQGSGGQLADALLAQAPAAAHQQLQGLTAQLATCSLSDSCQKFLDFAFRGQRQRQHGNAAFQFPRQLGIWRGDHQGVGFLAQLAGQVAQPPADGGILHIAVEIQQ